jgi:hypothetical protein
LGAQTIAIHVKQKGEFPLIKHLYRLIPLGLMFGLLLGLQGLLVPTLPQSVPPADACNPCDCPDDGRVNCQGIEQYGVYTRDTTQDETCEIDVYRVVNDAGKGELAFRVTEDDLADLPERPEENTLIDEDYEIALYLLTSGEFQVNAGPYAEGKVYTVVFKGCPAEKVREESFFVEQG